MRAQFLVTKVPSISKYTAFIMISPFKISQCVLGLTDHSVFLVTAGIGAHYQPHRRQNFC